MAANFWRAWWAWLISAGIAVIVSLFTEKRAEAELHGLVRGLTEKIDVQPTQDYPFYQKPGFWAAITLAIVIALDIYFW